MATITELLSSIEQNSKQYDAFLQDLMISDNNIPLDVKELNAVENAIISTINTRLNQINTRHDGLVILNHFLPKCSDETLSKYGVLWITKATQVVENANSSPQQLTLACKILGILAVQCKNIPDLQKQMSTQSIKQLINAIGNLESNAKNGAIYYLLATFLYHYPEICERFQTLIKKIILLQADATHTSLIKSSAICFALFARATKRTFKPIPTKSSYTCWTYHQALICNSLHFIMNELFSDLVELQTTDIWDKLELPDLSESHVMKLYSKQIQRFQNICVYLHTMLHGCEEKNTVLPTDILLVLCRGLAITPVNIKSMNSLKGEILYLLLPKLHLGLLQILEALIEGFRQELVPFGDTILQLLHQTLQWSGSTLDNQITINGSKPFENVRISTYKCLSLWLKHTNSASGIETVANECLSCILEDVVPFKDHISLTIHNTQYLSKRGLKRLRDSQYEKSPSLANKVSHTTNTSLNTNLCIEALVTLQNILLSANISLKEEFYKKVQNTVISLLCDYYIGTSKESFYQQDAQCRLQLLKTLKALQIKPHASVAPPTRFFVEIFEMALNDVDINIIDETRIALAGIETTVHPVAPTLYLNTCNVENDRTNDNCADNDSDNNSSEIILG